jgi:hypothetical protein
VEVVKGGKGAESVQKPSGVYSPNVLPEISGPAPWIGQGLSEPSVMSLRLSLGGS